MALLTRQLVGTCRGARFVRAGPRRGRSRGRSGHRARRRARDREDPTARRARRVAQMRAAALVLCGIRVGARTRPSVRGVRGRARRVPARARSESPERPGRRGLHGARARLPVAVGACDRARLALQHERYRSHRAVRALLELLATTRPLVLVLDDFHWADSASVELLGALLRRPPAAPVLIVARSAPAPDARAARSCARASAARRALTRVELGALTPLERLGELVRRQGADVLYEESGGNPFYLEQLARSRRPREASSPGPGRAGAAPRFRPRSPRR